MKDIFTDSKQWHEKLFFTKDYVILEQFDRYKNGEVYDVYFIIYDKDGKFITNEMNVQFADIIKKYQ